jgi:hypothetical protein
VQKKNQRSLYVRLSVHDREMESEKFLSTQSSAGNVKFLGQDILGMYSNEEQREPKQVTDIGKVSRKL